MGTIINRHSGFLVYTWGDGMKKNLFALMIMILSLSAVFAEDISKTVVYKEGDIQYSKIEKEVFWYNKDSKLIKVETYFNENGSQETGFDIQVTHFTNGNPVKYELFYNKKEQEEHSILVHINHVDMNNNIIKSEYHLDDNSKWILDRKSVHIPERFVFTSLRKYTQIPADDHSMTIEARVTAETASMKVESDLVTVDSGHVELLRAWTQVIGAQDMTDLYQKYLPVTFEGKEIHVLVQNGLHTIVNNDMILAYYYYVGNFKGIPVFAIIGYFDGSPALPSI